MTASPVSQADPQRPPLRARKMNFPFKAAALPRYWAGNDPLTTHISNGLNLLFPLGERFFIRSVRAYMDAIQDDPELLAQVRGFMAQEVRHGMEHERFFECLEDQGFDIQTFLKRYEHIAYTVLEPRFPPIMRLSVTVALEHYTALLGEQALNEGLDDVPEPVRSLMIWHAAEEIEHKSVAFDVLQRVDPRYSVRAAGMALATLGLITFTVMAVLDLQRQDKDLPPASPSDLLRDPDREPAPVNLGKLVLRGLRDYMRPAFHPDQHDNYALAQEHLAALGERPGG